jgi:DNA polymerase-3 subunit alpha
MSSSSKVKDFLDDARRANVEIRPPHIERSAWEFELEDAAIRFGFGAIKGTGPKAIDAIVARARAARRKSDRSRPCTSSAPKSTRTKSARSRGKR